MKEKQKQEKASKKRLTARQQKLVEEMANPKTKSVADAAKKAGFAPSSIRSTVYSLVKNKDISEAIEERKRRVIAHSKVTPEEVLGSAVFQMRSSMADLIDDEGYFDLKKAKETGAIDLIKELDIEEKYNLETKEKITRYKVKMLTNQDARKEVANYIGLEKVGQQSNNLSAEQLALKFLSFLIEKGIAEARAREITAAKYPEIDITEKLLLQTPK